MLCEESHEKAGDRSRNLYSHPYTFNSRGILLGTFPSNVEASKANGSALRGYV
jgi:hypothetical protein